MPSAGTALLTTEPVRGSGAESMIMAVTVPVAAPTANPCTTRATSRPPTPPGEREEHHPQREEHQRRGGDGRRPTRSDSEPTVSRATSSAATYTAKTTVSVKAERPQSRW